MPLVESNTTVSALTVREAPLSIAITDRTRQRLPGTSGSTADFTSRRLSMPAAGGADGPLV